ncbi:uncharacterized protein [Henckelia pumila]|uniref:uncharacterized protein n=1 Tax=Henckelia pumila TaxID=405737 RepID=UPI003C6E95D1
MITLNHSNWIWVTTKAHVNGQPISRVLVDNSSVVNILTLRVFKNLEKEETDLIPTEVSVTAITGEATKTIVVFPVEVLVGSKTSISAFFLENSSANFQVLLEMEAVAAAIKKALVQQIVDLDLALAPSQLEDHQPHVQDPLEEVNLGYWDNPKPIYISSLLNDEFKSKLKELLKNFKDCFAWIYEDILGLDQKLVKHCLPIKDDFKQYKQPVWRMSKKVEAKLKEEIEKYVEWISNVVPVVKKNVKLRICIDFKDLNRATPKDVYVMPIADMLVYSEANMLE